MRCVCIETGALKSEHGCDYPLLWRAAPINCLSYLYQHSECLAAPAFFYLTERINDSSLMSQLWGKRDSQTYLVLTGN